MSLRLLPEQELDYNDYARWQFETHKAEWEAEQPEADNHRCCQSPSLTLASRLAYKNYKLRTVRTVACRSCRQVVAGEID